VIKPIVLLIIYPIFSSLEPTNPPLSKREDPKEHTVLHIYAFIDLKTISFLSNEKSFRTFFGR
jgi:hypothetical protein